MSKLIKNVVKRPWTFLVTFKDGREEYVTVESESYHNAVYGLPRGKKKYRLIKDGEQEEQTE